MTLTTISKVPPRKAETRRLAKSNAISNKDAKRMSGKRKRGTRSATSSTAEHAQQAKAEAASPNTKKEDTYATHPTHGTLRVVTGNGKAKAQSYIQVQQTPGSKWIYWFGLTGVTCPLHKNVMMDVMNKACQHNLTKDQAKLVVNKWIEDYKHECR